MSSQDAGSSLKNGAIVGIDLGTTNSVVSIVRSGIPEVIREDGEAIVPSVVGLDPSGQLLIGQAAKNQLVAFPERTIASVKRHMGKMDPLPLGDKQVTPPEVSAMILRRLRDRASAAIGEEVTRAVITVPAFFDESQRQATREAGRLAGLEVERIINEPTAATLVYRTNSAGRAHLIVYDFGGGTFDVSIVRMEDGVIEVLASKGDTRLGGDDLDFALMNFVADSFLDRYEVDLRKNPNSRWRLLQACEVAKKRLSVEEEVQMVEEFIAEKNGQPLNLDLKVTRGDFEYLAASMVDRTIDCVDQALRDSGLALSQIDDLLLVGGSTRIPLVQDRLREEFKLEPSRSVDPDLAVAMGAAVQAAMIAGESVGRVLVDVTTHTLGIEALTIDPARGPRTLYSPIIHRNTPLPVSHERAYYAVHEEQKGAEINVFQGEHENIEQNYPVGNFHLTLDNPGQDRDKVVVRFDLTLDGTLKVTATQPASGIRESLTINNALSRFRDEDADEAMRRLDTMFETVSSVGDIQRIDSAAGNISIESHQDDTMVQLSEEMREEFAEAIEMLTSAKRGLSKMTGEDAEELRELVGNLEQAVLAQNRDEAAAICGEIDDVLFYAEG